MHIEEYEYPESGRKRLSLRIVDDSARQILKVMFGKIEKQLSIDGIGIALFTVIMELVGNAVKANLKRAFFRRHGLDISEPESYSKGIQAFRNNYENIKKEEYRQALEELDLTVTVEVNLDDKRLLTYVENNAMMQIAEEQRVREKLSQAMQAGELLDFFLQYGDDLEGSGIGLAMIVFLIKQIGFDPGNFRVFHRGNKTVARIEFPLNKDYVPIRERYLESEYSI